MEVENKEVVDLDQKLKRNSILVHVCGGGAHNIADKALKDLRNLGNGFAKVSFSFIDTSKNNYESIEQTGPFYKIKRKASSQKTEISGSGGDRSTNAYDVALNIPDYLDSLKIREKRTGEYHLVLCSGGGGYSVAA